jgi:hypothetical protein
MKRYFDYTDDELLEIYRSGKIEGLIDVECAHKGLPLSIPRPTEPTPVIIEPDMKAYKVLGVYFTSLEAASHALEAFTCRPLFDDETAPGGKYHQKILKPLTPGNYNYPKIETEMVFSEEHWNKVKGEAIKYNKAKEEYDRAKKEFDDIEKTRKNAADDLMEHIDEIQTRRYRLERATGLMERYLGLAEGNQQIAINFFKAADNDLFEEFQTQLVKETQDNE